MAITLTELKAESRQRADMENSNLVSDTELTTYINKSIAELHDLLSEAYGSEYFVKEGAETFFQSWPLSFKSTPFSM